MSAADSPAMQDRSKVPALVSSAPLLLLQLAPQLPALPQPAASPAAAAPALHTAGSAISMALRLSSCSGRTTCRRSCKEGQGVRVEESVSRALVAAALGGTGRSGSEGRGEQGGPAPAASGAGLWGGRGVARARQHALSAPASQATNPPRCAPPLISSHPTTLAHRPAAAAVPAAGSLLRKPAGATAELLPTGRQRLLLPPQPLAGAQASWPSAPRTGAAPTGEPRVRHSTCAHDDQA